MPVYLAVLLLLLAVIGGFVGGYFAGVVSAPRPGETMICSQCGAHTGRLCAQCRAVNRERAS